MSTRRSLGRRGLLLFGLAGGVSAVLAACGAPAAPTQAPAAAKPADAAAKPADAAAKPTAGAAGAPSAAAKPTEGTQPAAAKPAGAPGAVSLDFWLFDEFATGQALEIMNSFVKQFEAANPAKINVIGKPSQAISSGLVAGASSGALPDGVSTQFVVAARLLSVNVVKEVTSYWNSMSEDYRKQFSPNAVKILNQNGKVWGAPYTSFSTVLYRNLTVLEKSGIDPASGIKDWADFLTQAKKVKDGGGFAAGKTLGSWFGMLHYYGGIPGATNQVAPDGKKTTMSAEGWGQVFDFLLSYQESCSDVVWSDQAATDLFISNKMAFTSTGPWQNAPLAKAKESSGLKYDTILMPGPTAEKKAATRGGEFLAVMSASKQPELTWKWLTFVADLPQMKRWAGEFGRMVANDAAMADPEVQKNPLLRTTTEAYKIGVDEAPFFFNTPPMWSQPMADYGTLVLQKKVPPKEAAAKAIEEINKKLAEG
jgi:multiple sugar transport system substrate-binding protein